VTTFLAIFFWVTFAVVLAAIALVGFAVLRLAQEGLFTTGSNRGWSERMGMRNAVGNRLLVDPKFRTLRNWLFAVWSVAIVLFLLLFVVVSLTR